MECSIASGGIISMYKYNVTIFSILYRFSGSFAMPFGILKFPLPSIQSNSAADQADCYYWIPLGVWPGDLVQSGRADFF